MSRFESPGVPNLQVRVYDIPSCGLVVSLMISIDGSRLISTATKERKNII